LDLLNSLRLVSFDTEWYGLQPPEQGGTTEQEVVGKRTFSICV